ncbi:AT-rich interactive domain-containing protein 2, partial [Geodia barretti]
YSWCDLLHHAVNCHISPLSSLSPSPCHWAGCNTTPLRMKPSLIRHLETHHCSPGPKPIPPSVAVTLAKLQHCPPLENEVESPLTKAVRVTAALVLRNLCRMAPSTHCQIRRHEHRLSEVALSDREAAHAITECLTYLNLPSPPPPSLAANPHDNTFTHHQLTENSYSSP